jgi:uncharacterized repeat protein (TIGR03803 family)
MSHSFLVCAAFRKKHGENVVSKLAHPKDAANIRLWLTGAVLAALGPLAAFAPAQTGYTLTTLASFSDSPNGVVLSGSTLYGTTEEGGANNNGEVFSVPTSGGTPTVLASFNVLTPSKVLGGAAFPSGLIVSGSTLYGTTLWGSGSANQPNDGAVFSLPTTGGTPTVLATFNGTNGHGPNGLLLSGSTLYGTTNQGGTSDNNNPAGYGTVFSVPVAGGTPAVLESFNDTTGTGAIDLISGNTLYGTAANGTNGTGTVFSLPATGGTPNVLASFSGGIYPDSLVLSGSTLYGTTEFGGANNEGAVFSVPITGGTPTILASFNDATGTLPVPVVGNLILSGGMLYGATAEGGANGEGTVFSVPITGGTPAVLASFNDTNEVGGIDLVSGSTLYGTTLSGGTFGGGTVFELSVTAVSWTQPQDGNWSTSSYWSPATVPTSMIDADFNTGFTTPYNVTLTEDSAANNLNVQGDSVELNTAGNTLTVAGELNIGPGSGGTPGTLTIIADNNGNGTVTVANGVNISAGGTLSGNATIMGTVSNAGAVAPGTFTTPGALYIGGNYSQQSPGALNIRINGTVASGNFDSLQVTGSATLAGNLNVTAGGGFVPTSGDSYKILTASSLTGTFDNTSPTIQTTQNNSPSGQSLVSYSNNSATLIWQPLLMLANLSNNVYGGTSGYGGYSYVLGTARNPAFNAQAYSNSDGSQIVIAFQGTVASLENSYTSLQTFKTIAADMSFGGSTANSVLADDVSAAAQFVEAVEDDDTYKGANIILTGHSLGGAIAQIIGEASGLTTAAFNAPGGQAVYNSLQSELEGLTSYNNPGYSNTNYRLYGDQISQFGSPIGTQVTLQDPAYAIFAAGPSSDANCIRDLPIFGMLHSINTVIAQIAANAPAVSTANEPNFASLLQNAIQPSSTSGTLQNIYQFIFNVTNNNPYLVDPNSGSDFLFAVEGGAPLIASVDLPADLNVAEYNLRYETDGIWSPYSIVSTGAVDTFADAEAIEFQPLDSNGDNVTEAGSYFDISFESSGTLSATLTATNVPEPRGILLLFTAPFLLGRSRYCKHLSTLCH